ncbi:putative reverse transcriptase domain-containing protein [Tanacetum coccineum]
MLFLKRHLEIDQGVTAALVARDATGNGDDSHTSRTGVRRNERIVRECTYQDFTKCQPLYFKGTEGVVELTQWFERMVTVFRISNCSVENQIKMFPEESDKIERYVDGLPDMIHSSVVASKPKTMQEAIEMATELMDKKISTLAERQAKSKRKLEDTSRNNQNQHQPFKRQNVARAYTVGSSDKKPATELATWPEIVEVLLMLILVVTKEAMGQVGNARAPAKVYTVGQAGTNPDANIVTGTFLLNNRYASILFDTGADRSVNTIIRGCTLNFLDHPFNINLMPVEMGSFDIIIGMDWLSKYRAVIVCAEKIVRIPYGNETLIICSDGSNQESET